MKLTDIPQKQAVPFANNGSKRDIPDTSSAGSGEASFDKGFPPETMIPKISGGIPPDGRDMNGILNALSTVVRWSNAGGRYSYDSAFSALIGGYPQGATLLSSDGTVTFISTKDDNTTDPNSISNDWVAIAKSSAVVAISNTTGTVTLTAEQAAADVIIIDQLTGNLSLVFPGWLKKWTIANKNTSSFSVTCKTSSTTGIAITNSTQSVIYFDGANIVGQTSGSGTVNSVDGISPDGSGDVTLNAVKAIDTVDADLNTIPVNSISRAGSSTLNTPTPGSQTYNVFDFGLTDGTLRSQIAVQLESTREIFFRSYANSTWSAWRQVATTDFVTQQLSNYGLKNTTGSGWWKDGSTGKIYQYGIAPAGSGGTFPIPFPNACEFVMPQVDSSNPNSFAPAYTHVDTQDPNGFTTTTQTYQRKFIAIGS